MEFKFLSKEDKIYVSKDLVFHEQTFSYSQMFSDDSKHVSAPMSRDISYPTKVMPLAASNTQS